MNVEVTVLAGIIHNPALRHRVSKVFGDCFSTGVAKWLWKKMSALGLHLSYETLANEVYRQSPKLVGVLAPAMDRIKKTRPNPGEWRYAVKELQASKRWGVMEGRVRSAFDLLKKGKREEAEAVILGMPRELRAFSADGAAIQDARAEARHVHDNAYSGPRMMTGMKKLDTLIGGFRRGQLVLWGGLPSHGKTTFSVHAANAFVCAGHNVFFATLEMTAEEIEALLLTVHSHSVVEGGVAFDWFDRRDVYEALSPVDKDKVERVKDHFASAPELGRFAVCHPELDETLPDIFDRAEQWATSIGLPVDVLMVDYLEIVAPMRRYSAAHEQHRETLTLAKRYSNTGQGGLGVLLWSPWQLKGKDGNSEKICKRGRVFMSDFAESSFAERASDVLGWNLFDGSVEGVRGLKMGVCKNRTTRKTATHGWSVNVDQDTCFFQDMEKVGEEASLE